MSSDAPVKKMTLFSLAIPILIEQVLRNLMGTVNVFMLSHYSDDAVAAVGVANQIINVVVIAFTMISAGAAIVINHALGAKSYKDGAAISMNAVTSAAGLGLLASAALGFFAEPFVRMVGLEAALLPDAVSYLRITGGAAIILALSTMMSTIFRCYGNARVPMAVVVLNNILNIMGTSLVIFRPFEIPLTGVAGVAVVRAASECVGLIFQIVVMVRSRFDFRIYDIFHVRFARVKRIVSMGLMSGMEGISYTLGQVVTTGFLTAFGAAALSAKVYVQNVDYYAYVIGLAIGQATQIIAGHKIGAGDFDGAYRFVRRNWRYIALCNVVFGSLMFALSPQLMSLFTEDPAIVALARQLFLIDIFIHAGRSLNHSFNYGLRSAGYVFWPMVIAVCSIWICNVGMGYVFSTVCGLGAVGLWLAQMADEWIRGLSMAALWLRRKWEAPLRKTQGIPESTGIS